MKFFYSPKRPFTETCKNGLFWAYRCLDRLMPQHIKKEEVGYFSADCFVNM